MVPFSIYVTVNREYNTYIYSTIIQPRCSLSAAAAGVVEEEVHFVHGDGAPRRLRAYEVQELSHQVLDLSPSKEERFLYLVLWIFPLQAGVLEQVNAVLTVRDPPEGLGGDAHLGEGVHGLVEGGLVGVRSASESPAGLNLDGRERYVQAGVPGIPRAASGRRCRVESN